MMAEKVLAVDDEDMVRGFIRTVLLENGYIPMIAKNGEEAMGLIKGDRPDLIIMDVLMPEQSGVKLFRQVKEFEDLKNIPIIIYSGIAKRTFLRTQAPQGVLGEKGARKPDAYIEKPAKPEYLAKVIREVLDKEPS